MATTTTPRHLVLAETILAAPVGSRVDTFDTPLTKVDGRWSPEAARRADAVADPATDPTAWVAALGPHEHATLTADGRQAINIGWCTCDHQYPDGATWVRYERWSGRGQEAHGYVCPTCRRLTQTG